MGKIKKRGIFFTFIAITTMAVFILIFAPSADVSLQKDVQSVRIRINSVDSYVSDLEDRYFETILRATAYKAILSMVHYINSTGSYIQGIDSAFYEISLNGTINGFPIDSVTGKKIMENNTIKNWTDRIAQTSSDTLNVNTTIIVTNMTVSQNKPWVIDSSLTLQFAVKSNVAEWKDENLTITTTISVEGFHDPYYIINTNRAYANKLKRSSIPFDQWNISKVREHLRNGTYTENPKAPSFLMRLSNITSSSGCCGVESLVNPNKVGISDQRESYVDYLFWTHTYNPVGNCTQVYNITNPSTGSGLWDEFRYFKLDIDHVVGYNITSQDAVKNCG